MRTIEQQRNDMKIQKILNIIWKKQETLKELGERPAFVFLGIEEWYFIFTASQEGVWHSAIHCLNSHELVVYGVEVLRVSTVRHIGVGI